MSYVSPTPEGWLSSEADRIKCLLDEGVIVSEIARMLVRDGTVHRHNKYASESSNIQALTIAAIRRLIRIHNWTYTTKSDHSSNAAKRVRMLRTDGYSFREIAQIVGNKNMVFDGVAVTTMRCYNLLINEGMKSLAKVFTFPDIEVEALPLTEEDRANRVFRLSLRQRQTITINIPIELVDED